MWNSVVLTLFLIDATNSIDSGSRALERPSNLRVGERNHNNVTLLWDFLEPENVTLRSVEFSLYLQSVGNPERKFHPRFESGPFIYRITDLFPKTEYIVKLFATTPDWQDSETVSTSFLTLPAELSIPVIMSAVGKPHGNFVEYLVTYVLQPPSSPVLRFEIHVCDSHCFEYSRNGTELTARVAVEFQSNFSITVTACYGEGEGGLVRLESKPFLGTTGISPFADALSFVAEKQGNKIMLGWHPPYHPKGPTSYYEIFVCDPTKEDFTVWDEEPPRSAEDPPLVTDDAYDLTFETDEVEADLSHSPILGQCATHEPLLLVMVNTSQSSFRFRIVFTKPPMDRFYQLDTFADRRRLFVRPFIAESLSLPPFSRIHIKIRSCAVHDESPNDSCGKFVDFELRTSVAGPSEVLSAEITPRADSLLISWQEPEEPNGPIDGYKLTIEGYGGSPKKIEKYIFEPYEELNKMFYTMEGYSNREGYNVGIAAFNWDLDNSSEIHIGKWIHMTTHASWISHFGPVILGLVVFSLGLFTLMSCLFRAASRENIVSPERVETPERGWAQPGVGAGVE